MMDSSLFKALMSGGMRGAPVSESPLAPPTPEAAPPSPASGSSLFNALVPGEMVAMGKRRMGAPEAQADDFQKIGQQIAIPEDKAAQIRKAFAGKK